jgi:hypothetical protein
MMLRDEVCSRSNSQTDLGFPSMGIPLALHLNANNILPLHFLLLAFLVLPCTRFHS